MRCCAFSPTVIQSNLPGWSNIILKGQGFAPNDLWDLLNLRYMKSLQAHPMLTWARNVISVSGSCIGRTPAYDNGVVSNTIEVRRLGDI